MSKFWRKASMLTSMALVSGSMIFAAAPSYAGNEIQIQALGDVIPACDILAQTVGRLVESVPGDGTDGFTSGRLISQPGLQPSDSRGELAIVGLSCNRNGDTMATITSPVQISGPTLNINTATTRAYAGDSSTAGTPTAFATNLASDRIVVGELPLMAVTSEINDGGNVKVSDAVLLTTAQSGQPGFIALGIGFEVEVNGPRIPSGQFGFATTLTVVPR